MSSTDAIFLLGKDGRLEKVPYSIYSSEDILQELIARYPDLLAGDQIDPDDPPRWLLVSREAGVPDADSSSDRWSLDHLLLDQRAIPTLVEVKRSSDTRIRREVIGQMLEYAANATRYWPADRIRSLAAIQCGGVEQLDRQVRELLDPTGSEDAPADVEAYWKAVEDNLSTGELRLLFVADELPRELRRIIEFLNEHMPKIEVLGIEVRHYAGSNLRALVPRVVGRSELTQRDRTPVVPRKKTTEEEFLQSCPEWARPFFEEVFRTAAANGLAIRWGAKGFSIRAYDPAGQPFSLFYGYPAGAIGREPVVLEIYLKYLEKYFEDTEVSASLRSALLGLSAFTERGQYTIGLELTEANLSQARASLPYLWNVYRQIQAPAV